MQNELTIRIKVSSFFVLHMQLTHKYNPFDRNCWWYRVKAKTGETIINLGESSVNHGTM